MEGEVRAGAGVQPWVERLNARDRANYEQTRAEEIDENSARAAITFREKFGDENLDPEKVEEVARGVATVIRDAFEQGMQMGWDIGRQEREADLNHMRSVEIQRLGGWG